MNEKDLRVNWKPIKECGCHFTELFDDIGLAWTKEKAEVKTKVPHEGGIPQGAIGMLMPSGLVSRSIHRTLASLPPEYNAVHQTDKDALDYGSEIFAMTKGRVFLYSPDIGVTAFYKASYPERVVVPFVETPDPKKYGVVAEAVSIFIAAKSKEFKGSGKSPFTQIAKLMRGR
mgnify:CR=1 FL=1